jgi:hypothetical protein
MPSKPRREDVFIEAFLSAYEDESWADADKDWVDRHTDGGIEVVAKRASDGKTLAIEHTLIQPFVSDKEDFAVFGRSFLKIEDDKSLIVPDAGFSYSCRSGRYSITPIRPREKLS